MCLQGSNVANYTTLMSRHVREGKTNNYTLLWQVIPWYTVHTDCTFSRVNQRRERERSIACRCVQEITLSPTERANFISCQWRMKVTKWSREAQCDEAACAAERGHRARHDIASKFLWGWLNLNVRFLALATDPPQDWMQTFTEDPSFSFKQTRFQ